MTARELLQQLDARGVVLGVDAGKLRVNAARGVLDDALKTAIAAHKAELLELVALRSAVPASSRVPVPARPGQRGCAAVVLPGTPVGHPATRPGVDHVQPRGHLARPHHRRRRAAVAAIEP